MIEIADLIKDLRTQLEAAVANAPQDGLRFEVGAAEIEVSVAVEKEVKTGTKVKVWVLETGAEGVLGRTSAHKLKLTLVPRIDGEKSVLVAGGAVKLEE